MDMQFTATERIHLFTRPIDKETACLRATRSTAGVKDKFIHHFDFDIDTPLLRR